MIPTTPPGAEKAPVYVSAQEWQTERPHVLVIACSDGRLQRAVDDFVQNHLGIRDYDRLYAPGGPGALATSGFELLRSNTFRRECTFLMEAHGVEHVILIFHGPAPGGLGPELATCADYRRKLPSKTPDELGVQHETDTREVVRGIFGHYLDTGRARISVYRAEVLADHRVRFVDLGAAR